MTLFLTPLYYCFAFQWMTWSGLWPLLCDGCSLIRDTASSLDAAGFQRLEMQRFRFSENMVYRIFTPHVKGVATV